jgi:hypothetical protein
MAWREAQARIWIFLVNQTFRKPQGPSAAMLTCGFLFRIMNKSRTLCGKFQSGRSVDGAAQRRAPPAFVAFKCKKEWAMLRLIEGSYASFFPREIDAMFRNRAETFSDRLGWEVEVKNGHERDIFDNANPLYLVSVDPDTEEYWGSLRLLPTTGPNMLRDIFPQLLDGEYIESATIWESSRICAAAVAGQPERSRSRVNYVLSELIWASAKSRSPRG